MVAGKRLSAEERIAQAARGLLHHVKDFRRVVAGGVVLDDVSLFRRDNHADVVGSGGDHPFNEILGDRFRTLYAIDQAGAYRQQLLGAAQWLYALTGAGRGNNADHCATSGATSAGRDSVFTETASSRYL